MPDEPMFEKIPPMLKIPYTLTTALILVSPAKCFVKFSVRPCGISTNCVALFSARSPWLTSCCGVRLLTIVVSAPAA